MDKFNETIKRFREKALEEKHRKMCEGMEIGAKLSDNILSKMRNATARDYSEWLKGYVDAGGMPTHSEDCLTPKFWLYVAINDFSMFALYGPQKIDIIIPKNIKFLGGELGHCNLYFMDGFKHLGNFIPVYTDTGTGK